MPYSAYIGLPGAGKSYSAVENVVLVALREHLDKPGMPPRTVVTNIPLNADLIREEFPGCDLRSFDVGRFVDLAGAVRAAGRDERRRAAAEAELQVALDEALPHGCVWVVDEAWRLWPGGWQVKDIPQPFKSILAEHRHRVDAHKRVMVVVVVTQSLSQISKFARELIDETYRIRKLSALGLGGRFVVEVISGAAEDQVPERRVIRRIRGKYAEKVWRYYTSHTMSQADGAGADESKIDSRGVVFKSPAFIGGGVFALLALVIGVWKVVAFFTREGPVTESAGARAVEVLQSGADRLGRYAVAGGGAVRRSGAAGRVLLVTGWIESDTPALSRAFLTDGEFVVAVPFWRFCRRWVEGWVTCTYQGEEYSSARRPVQAPAMPVSMDKAVQQ